MKAPKENPLASILKCAKESLYILQLKHGYYYVGTATKNLEDRITEHRNGKDAWFITLSHTRIDMHLRMHPVNPVSVKSFEVFIDTKVGKIFKGD